MLVPKCIPTLIGSLPHTNPLEAINLAFNNFSVAPTLPELPRRSFKDGMVYAHAPGLPALVVDSINERMFINTDQDYSKDLLSFYEKALDAEQGGPLGHFAPLPDSSIIESMVKHLQDSNYIFPVIKIQSIGPLSFQLQLTDQSGCPLFYNEAFKDVLIRQIILQACWLIRQVKPFAQTVVIFLDEPSLAAYGSISMLGVSRKEVIEDLSRVISCLKTEGVLVGVHVCGNTDWTMLIEAGVDVISYDAYSYNSSLLIYSQDINKYLQSGGLLALGIIPTGKLHNETLETIEKLFFSTLCSFESLGMGKDLVLSRSFITPSCGLGSMSVASAEHSITYLVNLSRLIQDRF